MEVGYQKPAFSEAQLAEFARLQLRLLTGTARDFVVAEAREVLTLSLGRPDMCTMQCRVPACRFDRHMF